MISNINQPNEPPLDFSLTIEAEADAELVLPFPSSTVSWKEIVSSFDTLGASKVNDAALALKLTGVPDNCTHEYVNSSLLASDEVEPSTVTVLPSVAVERPVIFATGATSATPKE